MMTQQEISDHVHPFDCAGWKAREKRNERRQEKIRSEAAKRRKAKDKAKAESKCARGIV